MENKKIKLGHFYEVKFNRKDHSEDYFRYYNRKDEVTEYSYYAVWECTEVDIKEPRYRLVSIYKDKEDWVETDLSHVVPGLTVLREVTIKNNPELFI